MAEYLSSERRKPDGEALRREGRRWIERIVAAGKLEKSWMDDAEKAVSAYTGERNSSGDTTAYDFNILFSNVETIVPAIINSPPQPDIRRRFADDDPAAKDVSELLERAIRIQVDDSRLQVEMESAAQDAFLAGRGIVRLRFKADVDGEVDNDQLHELAEEAIDSVPGSGERSLRNIGEEGYGDDPGSGMGVGNRSENVVRNESICFEAVSWRDYRHGPAKRWADRPWEAFRHSIPMEDIEAFADNAISDAQTLPEDKLEKGETDNDVIVWEVWCRKSHKVHFIEENTGKQLKIVDDPLGWSGFFPTCTPMQPIEVTGRLMPVNSFSIYKKLADELDTTTRRINTITKQMRVKGWYGGSATDMANILEADDTDFVPIADAELWAQNGGVDNAVAFWPIEKFVVVLKELYTNREQTKQAIYEITGISDIVRGATMASETATAQNIKSQWGSLRIQKMQRMMERAARDLFVMMAEIMPAKFSAQTLQDMTGVQLLPTPQEQMPVPMPPQPMARPGEDPQTAMQQYQQALAQARQAEEARQAKLAHLAAVNKLLNDNVAKYYRVDVESDSTVRADLTQKKAEQAEFLQGTAAYFQGVAPMVETGVISQEGALEIYAATARLFTLGKSTEDALEREIANAKEKAAQPKQEKPDPEMVKAQLEQQKAQASAQVAAAKAQTDQALASVQLKTIEAKSQADIAKVNADIEQRRLDAQATIAQTNAKLEADRQTHAMEMQKGELELTKLKAEIAKIGVSTMAQAATTQMSIDQADRPTDQAST